MSTENKFLIQAAKLLFKTFVSPVELLLFLNELSYSASISDIKKPGEENNGAFLISLLTEEILAPWIRAGKNDIRIISRGLYIIYDNIGPGGYHTDISRLIACFYLHNAEAPNYEKTHRQYRKYYTCLFDIYYYLDSCGEDYGNDVSDYGKDK
jgi:hypothetical protein